MIKKILVADDSITIQKIVAMAFEKEDALVEGVSNGKEAFDKMETFQPDIVLADVDMPGLTGFELSKKIKDDPKFNVTKVLLLASDFEDFDESFFKTSGADDHISKPFKSDDIIKKVVDLLTEKTNPPIEETIKHAPIDANKTIELSVNNLIEEVDTAIELTTADLKNTVETTSAESSSSKEKEEDILNNMIEDVESLKGVSEPIDTNSDYNELGEVDPTREDEIGDELDIAFKEIVHFGLDKESIDTPILKTELTNEPSDADTIVPEPEDLLEKMTPSTPLGKKDASGPNLIQESLSYFSQISHEPKIRRAIDLHRSERLKGLSQEKGAKGASVAGDQVKQILKNSLNTSIEKEIAELSNNITQYVREVVREITPKIAKDIIKEEIDKIKKS